MRTIASLSLCLLLACSSDPEEGPAGSPDSGSPDSGGPGQQCTAARKQALTPVDSVSTGEVKVLTEAGGKKTLYVDASAGGAQASATNPRVYLNLASVAKASVTDVSAETSSDWDLAIKRAVLFVNSGHGGPGQGGAAFLANKEFDAVTSADATAATFKSESFFDADCKANVDQTGAVKTSFDGWYGYDEATHKLTPSAGVWIVKGATGELYKVKITSYYATPEGAVGETGGRYTFDIGAL